MPPKSPPRARSAFDLKSGAPPPRHVRPSARDVAMVAPGGSKMPNLPPQVPLTGIYRKAASPKFVQRVRAAERAAIAAGAGGTTGACNCASTDSGQNSYTIVMSAEHPSNREIAQQMIDDPSKLLANETFTWAE